MVRASKESSISIVICSLPFPWEERRQVSQSNLLVNIVMADLLAKSLNFFFSEMRVLIYEVLLAYLPGYLGLLTVNTLWVYGLIGRGSLDNVTSVV